MAMKMMFTLMTIVLSVALEGATAILVNVSLLMYDERLCFNPNTTLFESAAKLAISRAQLPSSLQINFRFVVTEDECSETGGILEFVRLMNNPQVDAVIGAVGSPVCQAAVSLAAQRLKPFVSWRCAGVSTSDRQSLAFARTVPPAWHVAHALVALIRHFGWKYCVVVTTDEGEWPLLAYEIDLLLRESRHIVRNYIILHQQGTSREAKDRLSAIGPLVKVVILCLEATSDVMLSVMQAAEELHMTQGGFTFLAVHVQHTLAPNAQLNIPHQHSLDHLFILTFISSNTSSYLQNLELTDLEESEVGDHVFHQVYDSVALFASALDKTWKKMRRSNFSIISLINHTKRITFPGYFGPIHMNSRGDRQVTYILLAYNEEERAFQDAFSISDSWTVHSDHGTDWFRDRIMPPDLPCVLKEEGCYVDFTGLSSTHIAAVIVSSFFITLSAVFVVVMIRRRILQNEMTKGPNKILILPEDLVFVSPRSLNTSRKPSESLEGMLLHHFKVTSLGWPHGRSFLKDTLSQATEINNLDKPDLLKGSHDSLRGKTNSSSLNGRRMWDEATTRARYNGDLVHVKYLPTDGFEIKNKTMKELKMFHDLRHENVNAFLGLLLDSHHPALIYDFCSRGSLADVIASEDVKLDWAFKLSLLTDLVRGMKYLHSSTIRHHGRLTSRNCIIDSRWVLKLTDYGLPAFFESQNIPHMTRSARDLLWTAPELLRDPNSVGRATQPGDVYSFAIIMQEVVVRGSPYCMLTITPEEIIEKVKRPPPLIRPSVSKQAAPPEAINIMRQCWAESSEMRPDFNAINEHFKKLNQGKKVNIVDTMFQMLEKYSNNLEELIRERTEQLAEEKKKTEQLLHRMLPSSVAEKLMRGMPVEPEAYEEVTIYFSDIVGFTTISAYSTPMEIVDLLNDLYTCFDDTINGFDVYKVETIGDAYMVVGGLPIRIENHAGQIAMMALDLLYQSGRFKIRHMPGTPLKLRIGVHSGPCCSGVVGLTMPRYCLFGDTVNTAARMESTGIASRIHISETTKINLEKQGGYHIQYRGEVELKGKGKASTYWLLGKDGFDKELPIPGDDVGSSHGIDEEIVRRGRLSSVSYPQDQGSLGVMSVTACDPVLGSLSTIPAFAAEQQRATKLERPRHNIPVRTNTPSDDNACITVEFIPELKRKENDNFKANNANNDNGDLNGNVSVINTR